MGFTVGFLFAYHKIDQRINTFIIGQLPLLYREVELENTRFDFEKVDIVKGWEKSLWALTIFGLMIPLSLYYVFDKIDPDQADVFLYLGFVFLVVIVISFVVVIIYLKNRL
jgi:hypothetical protein